ncbi:NAD(P)-dependent oxidoreductase [Caldalkalibacillus salinus]|uniref:NAD(P)-dependent oxidoreductase n=1 Tax=Caldalkalibacillus salinus TaxID=2803787 RepID=UPI001923BC59
MSQFKVVVTDYEYATLDPEKEVLENIGAEIVPAQCRTEEEVIAAAKDADGIINQYAPITRRVIEQLDRCKVIARYGIGVDTIDIKAATEKGIAVGNVTDYCLDEVSDHALALLMSAARKVTVLDRAVKQGTWDYKVGTPIFRLRDRTLGLVGFGKIPQQLAQKAQALGLNVIAYDPYMSPDIAQEKKVTLVSLDELSAQSDFISVHAPLLESTRGMISQPQFELMKSEAILINTSRGPVVDEDALIAALQQNKIAGAALDVLEQEPVPADHPFLSMDQVILNPHVAWYAEESERELKRKTAQNVADTLTGGLPHYLVNKELKPLE